MDGLLPTVPARVRQDSLSAPQSSWATVLRVAEAATAEDLKLVIVNVSNTAVVRSVVGDENIEQLLADQVGSLPAWKGTSKTFAAARRAARTADPRGSTLSWYESAWMADDCHNVNELAAAELELQQELVRPVPGAQEALLKIRNRGISIRFVCNTSLLRNDMATILQGLGLARPDDRVIVSCEHPTASTIDLARIALDCFPPSQAIHVGTSSDFSMGKLKGLRAVVLDYASPSRYELCFAKAGIAGGIVAAAARSARLTCSALPQTNTEATTNIVLNDIGASLLGSALVAFGLWNRQTCRSRGITQVAYCARDGELPMRVAAALPPGYWDEVTTVYLHGNRQSWSVAGIEALGTSAWMAVGRLDENTFVNHGLHSHTLETMLERIGLVSTDIPSDLAIAAHSPVAPLPRGQSKDWDELLDDNRVRQVLRRRSVEQLALLSDYLRGIGISSGTWALVDVGWRGQLASMVSATVTQTCGSEPLSLHFGAIGTEPSIDELFDVERFAFDDAQRPAPFRNIVPCVENFTGSGSERASGFCRGKDGNAEPVMIPGNAEIATEERRQLWAATIETAKHLPEATSVLATYLDDVGSLADPSGQVFAELWTHPTLDEAAVIGSFEFELDQRGKVLGPIALPYTVMDLITRPTPPRRQWRSGSLAITPTRLRLLLTIAEAGKSLTTRRASQAK